VVSSGVEPVVTACLSGKSPSNSYQKTIAFFEAGDKVTAIVWKKQREVEKINLLPLLGKYIPSFGA